MTAESTLTQRYLAHIDETGHSAGGVGSHLGEAFAWCACGWPDQATVSGDNLTTELGDDLVSQDRHCRTYWGSHGCDLPRGHDFPIHMCGFGERGGPHSFHDGARCWAAEWAYEGDEDDPPASLSPGMDWGSVHGEDVPS